MSIQKKVGRLLIAGFKGTVMSEEIKYLIHEYHIGGVILFGRNIGTPEEVLSLTKSLQMEARKAGYKVPLLICIDQENGVVRRLGEGTTIIPGAMLLGATQNPAYSYQAGLATAKQLKALGINWNLAPVVDINNNPKNPVIGVRSFGEDPQKVTEMAMQSMLGMQSGGVMTTLKHFPGHGDTSVDSHLDLPVITHSLERLHEVELLPFKKCIEANADAIMSAHVYFPALEKEKNVPATLSRAVITGLLREELGFEGVITTDCMEMDAIAKRIGTVEGCIKAVEAGVDFVMVSHIHSLQEQAVLKLAEAVEAGSIDERQIDCSINRIEVFINKYTSWEEIEQMTVVPSFVGSEEEAANMKEIYQAGISIIGDIGASIQPTDSVLLVFPTNEYATMVEDKRYATMEMAEQLKKVHKRLDILQLSPQELEESMETVVKQAEQYDRIVALTLNAVQHPIQATLVNRLIDTGIPADIIAVRTPYDAALFPDANRMICTYEFTQPAFEVVAEFLIGKQTLNGKPPVQLSV